MELDAKIKRADFIDKTVNIRETFSFALPTQVIQAIDKYCGDHYGGMLWSFDGQGAGQYFRCWHRCISANQTHVSLCEIFQRLFKSSSPEVALLANIAGRDMSSTTGRNLNLIYTETGLNPWCTNACSKNLRLSKVPQSDDWRLPLLKSFLSKRYGVQS